MAACMVCDEESSFRAPRRAGSVREVVGDDYVASQHRAPGVLPVCRVEADRLVGQGVGVELAGAGVAVDLQPDAGGGAASVSFAGQPRPRVQGFVEGEIVYA